MRIDVSNVTEFIESLAAADGVFDLTLRVSILKREVNEVKYEIILQAAAVVQTSAGSEYLLQMGQKCGIDYKDATGSTKGSDEAQSKREQLKQYAETRGWRILPGLISE